MKNKKQQEHSQARIYTKDHDYLMGLKKKWKVIGIDVVLEKIIIAVKKHLSEEDLK